MLSIRIAANSQKRLRAEHFDLVRHVLWISELLEQPLIAIESF
jgi:hypothetical protein